MTWRKRSGAQPGVSVGSAHTWPRPSRTTPRHHDEAQTAEAVIIELDEARLDQIDGLLIPVVHLGDTPPTYDAFNLGHATSVAAEQFDLE